VPSPAAPGGCAHGKSGGNRIAGHVIQSSLSNEQEAALQDALDRRGAAA
jgi:uncharacterized membrane protein